jgi:mannose-1-phosphate guanylyltransferase/mannose-6-phosphate isomerase
MGSEDDRITPLIICGGSGTRLWPASRNSMPKQFAKLIGPLSTFQEAVRRVADPELFEPPIILTGDSYRFVVAEQLAEIGVAAQIVLEPSRRDSAPAIAAGVLVAAQRRADPLILVLPADHLVGDNAAFGEACAAAKQEARAGRIMTIGIRPTGPATIYGYIKPGEAIGSAGCLEVKSFVEKPPAEDAARYVAEGYFWNGGYFLFGADAFLAELEVNAPTVAEAAAAAVGKARTDLGFIRLDATEFARAPKISVDFAVMEHAKRLGVVPATFAWSDIGTWGSLHGAVAQDDDGNVLQGDVVTIGTRDSLVMSEGKLTAVVGLSDIVVVTTPDAVLISSKEASGRVKDLVETLQGRGRREATEHLRSYRPWGWYQTVDSGTRFQVKRIVVKPGGALSLQKHHHRAEHWIVVCGTAEVTVGEDVKLVHENEGIYIPIGSVHRLANPGKIPLELIEVQVGSYTGEDDIIRIEDVYGR